MTWKDLTVGDKGKHLPRSNMEKKPERNEELRLWDFQEEGQPEQRSRGRDGLCL